LPDVSAAVEEAPESCGARLLELGLAGTDERVHADKSVTPMFLFGVLLWPAILRELGVANGPIPDDPAELVAACDVVGSRQFRRIAVPKRFSLPMRDMIALQPRFNRRSGRRTLRFLEHPRFRAAYDFMLLRAASGEVDPELAAWWTRLQELPATDRIREVESQPRAEGESEAGPRRRRRPRRRRPPAA
jgi:poly(A) polymerase